MKTIKNVFLIILLLAGTTAFAQKDMGNRPQRPEAPMNHPGQNLIEKLNLNPDQKAKLDKINMDYHQKDSTDFADFRKQEEGVRLEQMKDFKSILTKDQLDQFEKMQDLRAAQVLFNDGRRPERMGQREAKGQQDGAMSCQKCPMTMGMQKQHKPGVGMNHPQAGMEKGKMNHQAGKRAFAKLSPEERAQKLTGMLTVSLDLKADQVAKIKNINLKYALKDASDKSDKTFNRKQMKARQTEIKSILDKQQLAKYETFLKVAKKGHSQKKLK